VRIWPGPRFTHWPAIAYPDESRDAAVVLPLRQPGGTAGWGWEGAEMIPLRPPVGVETVSGLVSLMLRPASYHLRVELSGASASLSLRVADVAEPWPLVRLRDGFPVDADDVPVVLLDRRRQPGAERTWALLRAHWPRPIGRPLLVGDPLPAMDGSAWTGLDAEQRPATDPAKSHHACLVALARLPDPLPRTIIWSPGNGSLDYGAADPEEVRLLGALRSRCEALQVAPLLILALPPEPVEVRLRVPALERREALVREADLTGWRVIDLARVAGDADTANRVGDEVFAAYPVGEAQIRMRDQLAAALRR
jgi:hypothetical protein